MSPGHILLKRHVQHNKYEPLVNEVELLEANPDYAHIRFDNGWETTVSIRQLAPNGTSLNAEDSNISNEAESLVALNDTPQMVTTGEKTTTVDEPSSPDEGIRRSGRMKLLPVKLRDYHLDG